MTATPTNGGAPARYRSRTGRSAHLLVVSYLFAPTDLPPARRARALCDAFAELGVRTTALTSAVSGTRSEGEDGAVVRAPDLRARVAGPHLVLAEPGRRTIPNPPRRRWTRIAVPDSTAISWMPAALPRAARIARTDRPDAVFTTSPPESTHIVGLALRAAGIPWIADLRDGWTFEPPTPRPYLRSLDRALERLVVRRADLVTAVTAPLVEHLSRADGGSARVVELANGFDPRTLERASDERALLDPSRFSLVYTGTGALDGKDPRPFLRALARLLAERPSLSHDLEVVFAGNFTAEEVDAMGSPELDGVARFVGRLEHVRALGLQRAADGLLLITTPGARSVVTGKIYEYLAARKPILALADGNAAAALLGGLGNHVAAPPDDEERIAAAIREYLDDRLHAGPGTNEEPHFDPMEFAVPRLAQQLLDLFVEIGALERT